MPEKFSDNEMMRSARIAKSLMNSEDLAKELPMFSFQNKKRVALQQKVPQKN